MSAFAPVSQTTETPSGTGSVRTSYDLFPPLARAAGTFALGVGVLTIGVLEGGLALWPMSVVGGVLCLLSYPVYSLACQGRDAARYDAALHAQKMPELFEEKPQPRATKAAVKLQKPAAIERT